MPDKKINYEKYWSLFSKGDMLAFRRIYSGFYPDLMRFGVQYLPQDQVENLVQDLFLYLLQHRSSLTSVRNVRAYLITALRNRITKYAAQNKLVLDELKTSIPQPVNEKVVMEIIPAILQKLSPREREIIHLRFYREFKNQEIANYLNIEYQTVRNILHNAIKKMRLLFVEMNWQV